MTILDAIFLLLVLLQLKHWYIDFVNQDMEEVNHKGIFLHWLGLRHSLKHGIGTYICIALVVGAENWIYGLVLGFFDFVTHYSIDWMKMNWGNRDIQTPAFWAHLGLDQMAHQLTYLWIVYTVVA